jgi:shikimate dehydrogenase
MKSIRSISPRTKICAVIGNPVAHSLSPAIHNAAYEAKGLDFVYVAYRVDDVKNALAGMRALHNFRGMSITIPHKIRAMKYVDEVATIDRRIGSINTVVNEKGRLIGLGTDGPGAYKAMVDADVDMAGKQMLILGSGGAARAIAFTMVDHAVIEGLTILDIDRVMLQRLTTDLKAETDTLITSDLLTADTLATAMERAHIIIHCTPVGMHPNAGESLIPAELLQPGQVIFDIVYNPLETKLLGEAKSCGLKIISGVDMFINQAALQFERFVGVAAPVEVMRKVVMEQLES